MRDAERLGRQVAQSLRVAARGRQAHEHAAAVHVAGGERDTLLQLLDRFRRPALVDEPPSILPVRRRESLVQRNRPQEVLLRGRRVTQSAAHGAQVDLEKGVIRGKLLGTEEQVLCRLEPARAHLAQPIVHEAPAVAGALLQDIGPQRLVGAPHAVAQERAAGVGDEQQRSERPRDTRQHGPAFRGV